MAERGLVESGRRGVGGACLRVSQAGPAQRSGRAAREAVRAWSADTGTDGGRATFPYAETVAHYQCVGRANADPDLVSLLREAYGRLPDQPSILREWLPSTFDQDDGDYNTYIGAEAFASVVREAGPDSARWATDALMVAAAADLVLLESAALAVTPDRRQQARTRAAARVLTRSAEIAPDFRPAALAAPDPVTTWEQEPEPMRRSADLLARSVLDAVPSDVRTTVASTLLPTTRLHDEQMFIRCIQIFEGLYKQVADSLRSARDALAAGDVGRACGDLTRAATRVESTPVLYRVLTTMPIEVFAVIRGYTNGRSAIQSRAYREVEYLSAPSEPGTQVKGAPGVTSGGPSLQEIYRKEDGRPQELTDAMRRLDAGWRGMKLSHWGLTLKIIGRVPGTGGTTGADYLRQAADVSLFPCLVDGDRS